MRIAVWLLILCASSTPIRAQEHPVWLPGNREMEHRRDPPVDSVETFHPLLEALAMFAIPKILQDGVLLKDFVRGEEFRYARVSHGDVFAVDMLFRRALRMCWNNPYVTLLIVVTAVLDHHRVGVRLPLLGPLLWVPLTSEFPEEFSARRDALPKNVFPDSPAWGDRDKLQHFFGSALLAMLTESADAAERVGDFVEWGEESFVVEGTFESRDTEANRRGVLFGFAFFRDRTVLPSMYMQTPLEITPQDSVTLHQEIQP